MSLSMSVPSRPVLHAPADDLARDEAKANPRGEGARGHRECQASSPLPLARQDLHHRRQQAHSLADGPRRELALDPQKTLVPTSGVVTPPKLLWPVRVVGLVTVMLNVPLASPSEK